MISVLEWDATGATGIYTTTTEHPLIRVTVRGDEGGFEVEAKRWAANPDGRWQAWWPAKLARGKYTIRAELWKRTDHYAVGLTVS